MAPAAAAEAPARTAAARTLAPQGEPGLGQVEHPAHREAGDLDLLAAGAVEADAADAPGRSAREDVEAPEVELGKALADGGGDLGVGAKAVPAQARMPLLERQGAGVQVLDERDEQLARAVELEFVARQQVQLAGARRRLPDADESGGGAAEAQRGVATVGLAHQQIAADQALEGGAGGLGRAPLARRRPARRPRRRGAHHCRPGFDAGDAAQVVGRLEREDHLDVLGAAAASGGVEGVDRRAVAEQHLAGRLRHGAVGERVLGAGAAVDLTLRGAAQVVALLGEAAEIAQGVAARRHGLRLERLELRVAVGAELARHDAAQVVLERQLVDHVEAAAVVEEDDQGAAKSAAFELEGLAGGGGELETAPGHARARAVRRHLEGRIERAGPLGDHPERVESPALEGAPPLLGLLAVGPAPDTHPVEPAAGVEAGVSRCGGQRRQPPCQPFGLLRLAQRRHLETPDGHLAGGRRGAHGDRRTDRPRPVRESGTRRDAAARNRHALEVGQQTDADTLRQRRRGRRRRCDGRRRRRRFGRGRLGGRRLDDDFRQWRDRRRARRRDAASRRQGERGEGRESRSRGDHRAAESGNSERTSATHEAP